MERKVSFYSGPGLKLAAILETPDNVGSSARRPGIILCQGPGGVKEYLVPDVSHRLARASYIVLRLDYRGWGESEGPPNRLIPLEQVEDVQNAMTFMLQLTQIPQFEGRRNSREFLPRSADGPLREASDLSPGQNAM